MKCRQCKRAMIKYVSFRKQTKLSQTTKICLLVAIKMKREEMLPITALVA